MKVVKNPHPFHGERLLDYDPYLGVTTYYSQEAGGERWAIRQEFQDVSAEVDASREMQKDPEHWKQGVKGGWLHAAHIPDAILLKWHAMGVDINRPEELLRMCQRPEYRYLMCVDKVLT